VDSFLFGSVVIIDQGFKSLKKYLGVMGLYSNKDQYTAPEILTEKGPVSTNYDENSDVYSFGIVIWEVLHGKRVFEHMQLKQIISYVLEDKARPKIDA
jgi:serine/threonine protein kinase